MRKSAIVLGILIVAAAAWWWMQPSAPLPGPPLSMAIAAVAPAASAVARAADAGADAAQDSAGPRQHHRQTVQPVEENPLYKDPYYRRFFEGQALTERQVLAAGSGVVMDGEHGLVLTNNHVVKGAERIGVALSDGRRIEAKLIGSDPPTDIALVAIAASDLVAMPLGNSDALEIGDYVEAIGNPFGLGPSASSAPLAGPGSASKATKTSFRPTRR